MKPLLRALLSPGRFAALLTLLALVVTLVAACDRSALRRSGEETAPAAVAAASDDGGYLGDEACAVCHPDQTKAHHATRHFTTMRAASRVGLGTNAPRAGVIPLGGFSLEEQGENGGFVLTRELPEKRSLPLHLALGSGKVGITFISFLSKESTLEARMSYFPPHSLWDMTPGQEKPKKGDDVFGHVRTGKDAQRCVRCHSVTLPRDGLLPKTKFFGVGCESCHGPGKAHVAAAQAGNLSDLRMEKLGSWKSARLNDLCGKCHRTVKDVADVPPHPALTVRFQPVGLARSRCRNPDGSVLSCLTCHDPHTDAPSYSRTEAVCMSCHPASAPVSRSRTSATVHNKACPVNPRANCVSCHMPRRQAFPLMSISATMADHRIAIHAKGE